MTDSPFYMARCWAYRDAETKERLSGRYFSRRDLLNSIRPSHYEHTGRVVEIYASKMSRPIACRPQRVHQ